MTCAKRRTTQQLLLARIALSAVTGLLPLVVFGRRDLWADEAVSAYLARMPGPDLAQVLWEQELNGGLHTVLLWALRLGAANEWLLRLPSALAICVACYLLTGLAHRMVGARWSLLAGAFFAAFPGVIESASTARSNALAILAAVALMCLVDRPTPRRAFGYGVVAAAGMYLHFFLALLVIGHLGYLAATRSPALRRPRVLLAAAVPLGTLSLPLLGFVLVAGSDHISWIPETTPSRALAYSARAVVGLHGRDGQHDLTALLVLLSPAAAGALMLLAAALGIGHTSEKTRRYQSATLLALASAGSVIMLAYALSQAKPLFLPRYLWLVLPALALLLTAGIAALAPAARAVGLLVCLTTLATSALSTAPSSESWGSAAAAVHAQAEPGDVVDSYWPFLRPALAYYAPDRRAANNVHWQTAGPASRDQFFANSRPADTSTCRTPPDGGSLWLIVVTGREEGAVSSCTGRPVQRITGDGWHVLLLR